MQVRCKKTGFLIIFVALTLVVSVPAYAVRRISGAAPRATTNPGAFSTVTTIPATGGNCTVGVDAGCTGGGGSTTICTPQESAACASQCKDCNNHVCLTTRPPGYDCCSNADCGDGNACTTDTCNASHKCEHAAREDSGTAVGSCCLSDAGCDDGLFCNGAETCAGNRCQAGIAPAIADTVSCTGDSCDEAGDRIIHTPNDAACSDSDACSGVETCSASAGCVPGTPVVTDDGDACTIDSCENGNPIHTLKPDCCHDNSECADYNPCTADSCNANRCENTPISGVECDDSLFCTTGDVCNNGTCAGNAGANPCLDDGDRCTIEECVEGSPGECRTANVPVEDDSIATTVDVCDPVTGVTTHTPGQGYCDTDAECSAPGGNVCMRGMCLPTHECTVVPVDSGAPCEDGMYCTVDDKCNGAGLCVAGGPKDCSDDNKCTINTCDDERDQCTTREDARPDNLECDSSCQKAVCDRNAGWHCENIEGTCDDGNACTEMDKCMNGACAGSAPTPCYDLCGNVSQCDSTSGCAVEGGPQVAVICDDGDKCNGSETCDPTTGSCVKGETISCDDSDPCTGQETCDSKAGTCVAGTAFSCDDNDPCTTDTCVKGKDGLATCSYTDAANPLCDKKGGECLIAASSTEVNAGEDGCAEVAFKWLCPEGAVTFVHGGTGTPITEGLSGIINEKICSDLEMTGQCYGPDKKPLGGSCVAHMKLIPPEDEECIDQSVAKAGGGFKIIGYDHYVGDSLVDRLRVGVLGKGQRLMVDEFAYKSPAGGSYVNGPIWMFSEISVEDGVIKKGDFKVDKPVGPKFREVKDFATGMRKEHSLFVLAHDETGNKDVISWVPGGGIFNVDKISVGSIEPADMFGSDDDELLLVDETGSKAMVKDLILGNERILDLAGETKGQKLIKVEGGNICGGPKKDIAIIYTSKILVVSAKEGIEKVEVKSSPLGDVHVVGAAFGNFETGKPRELVYAAGNGLNVCSMLADSCGWQLAEECRNIQFKDMDIMRITTGDITGDGVDEIAVAGKKKDGTNTLRILFNEGGSFDADRSVAFGIASGNIVGIFAADLDGDGKQNVGVLTADITEKGVKETVEVLVNGAPEAGVAGKKICSYCGDGNVDEGEECDDGGNVDGDGCSASCVEEAEGRPPAICGNGVAEAGEECDGDVDCSADCRRIVPVPVEGVEDGIGGVAEEVEGGEEGMGGGGKAFALGELLCNPSVVAQTGSTTCCIEIQEINVGGKAMAVDMSSSQQLPVKSVTFKQVSGLVDLSTADPEKGTALARIQSPRLLATKGFTASSEMGLVVDNAKVSIMNQKVLNFSSDPEMGPFCIEIRIPILPADIEKTETSHVIGIEARVDFEGASSTGTASQALVSQSSALKSSLVVGSTVTVETAAAQGSGFSGCSLIP